MIGDFKGTYTQPKPNPKYCRAATFDGRAGTFQCSKSPTRDGYCGTHHPDAEKRRKTKSDKRSADWLAANELKWAIAGAEDAVVAAAKKWLEEYKSAIVTTYTKRLLRAVGKLVKLEKKRNGA